MIGLIRNGRTMYSICSAGSGEWHMLMLGIVKEDLTIGYWFAHIALFLFLAVGAYACIIVGAYYIKKSILEDPKSKHANVAVRVFDNVLFFGLLALTICLIANAVHTDKVKSAEVMEIAIDRDAEWVTAKDGRQLGPWALGCGYYGRYDVEQNIVFLRKDISLYGLRFIRPEDETLIEIEE